MLRQTVQDKLSQFWIFPPPSAQQGLNPIALLSESQEVGGGDGEAGAGFGCHLCSQTS